LGEISAQQLKRLNEEAGDKNPYRPGDLVGQQGLEARWETYLRGIRGNRLVQVDAFGRRSDLFTLDTGLTSEKKDEDGTARLPHKPAVPGSDLVLTLDAELQAVVRSAFSGKNGAVVVLDPRSGAILALLSEPGYDPS